MRRGGEHGRRRRHHVPAVLHQGRQVKSQAGHQRRIADRLVYPQPRHPAVGVDPGSRTCACTAFTRRTSNTRRDHPSAGSARPAAPRPRRQRGGVATSRGTPAPNTTPAPGERRGHHDHGLHHGRRAAQSRIDRLQAEIAAARLLHRAHRAAAGFPTRRDTLSLAPGTCAGERNDGGDGVIRYATLAKNSSLGGDNPRRGERARRQVRQGVPRAPYAGYPAPPLVSQASPPPRRSSLPNAGLSAQTSGPAQTIPGTPARGVRPSYGQGPVGRCCAWRGDSTCRRRLRNPRRRPPRSAPSRAVRQRRAGNADIQRAIAGERQAAAPPLVHTAGSARICSDGPTRSRRRRHLQRHGHGERVRHDAADAWPAPSCSPRRSIGGAARSAGAGYFFWSGTSSAAKNR